VICGQTESALTILDAVKRLGDPQVFKRVILEGTAFGRALGTTPEPCKDYSLQITCVATRG
jgi:hypothetical protein